MKPIQKAYRAFATKRFPLPTAEQIDQLEERIRADLPSDYRQFLLAYNGGYFSEPEIRAVDDSIPTSLLTCLFGINVTEPFAELAQPSYLALFEENDPPVILPIGDTPMNSFWNSRAIARDRYCSKWRSATSTTWQAALKNSSPCSTTGPTNSLLSSRPLANRPHHAVQPPSTIRLCPVT